MALPLTLGALGVNSAVNAYNNRALRTTKVEPNSAINHGEALFDAAVKRAATIAPEAPPLLVGTEPVTPTLVTPLGALAGHTHQTKDGKTGSKIYINPAADASYYAHELGHAVSQKTKLGKLINDARHTLDNHPKLGSALATSLMFSTPFLAGALQEGDDDLAESLAIAAAVASPKLIDEALASKNALAIMQDAGTRATLGQRGRLAAGYLSYLAPVLIAGSVGNFAGNLADDYTALYDL